MLTRSHRILWLVPEGLRASDMLLSTKSNPGQPEIIDLVQYVSVMLDLI